MSDLFSNIIDRAQGVAPALRPLHAYYRSDIAVQESSSGSEEFLETLPYESPSQPRIADRPSRSETRKGLTNQKVFGPSEVMESSGKAAVASAQEISRLPEATDVWSSETPISNTLQFSIAAATEVSSTTQSANKPSGHTRSTAPEVSHVSQREAMAMEKRPGNGARKKATIETGAQKPSKKSNSVTVENASLQPLREVISNFVWDKTAEPTVDTPAELFLPEKYFDGSPVRSENRPQRQSNTPQSSRSTQLRQPSAPQGNLASVVEPEERHVTVSIARLEVRVNPIAIAKPQAPSAPAVSTLDEYLRERRGGSR